MKGSKDQTNKLPRAKPYNDWQTANDESSPFFLLRASLKSREMKSHEPTRVVKICRQGILIGCLLASLRGRRTLSHFSLENCVKSLLSSLDDSDLSKLRAIQQELSKLSPVFGEPNERGRFWRSLEMAGQLRAMLSHHLAQHLINSALFQLQSNSSPENRLKFGRGRGHLTKSASAKSRPAS